MSPGADQATAGRPAPDRERWLAAVAAVVDRSGTLGRDAALERLRSTTYDGITIEPLYTAADAVDPAAVGAPGAAPFVRGRVAARRRWDVRQAVERGARPGRAVDELQHGATSVLLDLRAVEPGDAATTVGELLDGVLLDVAPVALVAGTRWHEAGEALLDLLDRHAPGDDPGGSLGADPLGTAAVEGRGGDLDDGIAELAGWFHRLGPARPALRLLTADGSLAHDAGASDAQQLGWTLAAGVDTARALAAHGVEAATALARTDVRLAATADQFATIASMRAARRVWARVAEVAGAPDVTVPLHAVTSTAMTTRYDPWVNALRATVACFAAGVGGADAVTVLPHDRLGDASDLGRRIARNTQSILLDESHVAEVLDPAGGSWYVERLTDDLAAAAWSWFQEIEAAGGFRRAVAEGLVAARIAATRTARQRDIDTRRAPLTGVTEFPNPAESRAVPVDHPPASTAGDDLGPRRWAEPIEALRARVERAGASGRRPAVHLATIGPPSAFAPRATFAELLFGIAGLGAVRGPTTDDPGEIAAAFAASGTPLACLCSSDAVYAERAAAVAAALREAGAAAVYVAGRPQDGIDQAIHVGVDVRATLSGVLDLMGVP